MMALPEINNYTIKKYNGPVYRLIVDHSTKKEDNYFKHLSHLDNPEELIKVYINNAPAYVKIKDILYNRPKITKIASIEKVDISKNSFILTFEKYQYLIQLPYYHNETLTGFNIPKSFFINPKIDISDLNNMSNLYGSLFTSVTKAKELFDSYKKLNDTEDIKYEWNDRITQESYKNLNLVGPLNP